MCPERRRGGDGWLAAFARASASILVMPSYLRPPRQTVCRVFPSTRSAGQPKTLVSFSRRGRVNQPCSEALPQTSKTWLLKKSLANLVTGNSKLDGFVTSYTSAVCRRSVQHPATISAIQGPPRPAPSPSWRDCLAPLRTRQARSERLVSDNSPLGLRWRVGVHLQESHAAMHIPDVADVAAEQREDKASKKEHLP